MQRKAKEPRSFRFDPQASPEVNIALFLAHLTDDYPSFAALLKENLKEVLPLPDEARRAAARMRFNTAIGEALT